MTKEEDMVIVLLCKAWDKFVELPAGHTADLAEFQHAIHAAQNIIMARVGRRTPEVD